MKKNVLLRLLLLSIVTMTLLSAATVYVKPIASGDGSGSSWANAMADIQNAINTSGATEVWIAAGTYYVSDADGFNPVDGVDVYGGFAGTENALGDRAKSDLNSDGSTDAWEFTNTTILSADLDYATNPDNYIGWPDNIGTTMDGNANHVVYQSANFTNETIWGGLWIQGGNADGTSASDSLGAGLYTRENFKLQNSVMRYNQAVHFGGGTYSYRGTVSYCRASHNMAKQGGGIYLRDNSSAAYCQADSNYAIEQGGGFSIYSADAQASNCKAFGNICDAIGGGYHIYLGNLSESSSYLNSAAGNGPGIYNNEGNIQDSDIYDNTMVAYGTGGGINSYKGTITRVNVYGNSSHAYGGGLYLRDALLSDSYIYNNQTTRSDGDGGGLSIQGTAVATNCVIYNNYAPDFGGGVYNSDADLINCTVTNNSSGDDGGGVYLRNAGADVLNCAAWGNQTAGSGAQMYQFNGNGTITYSATETSAQTGTGNIALSNGNAVDATSPYFVTPTTFVGLAGNASEETELENADWDITASSALKDAGTDTNAPSNDINGNARSTTDIGAYEQGAEGATAICLRSFEAMADNGIVRLTWETASETNNAKFVIFRNDKIIAEIEGAGTTTESKTYEYIDATVVPGVNYNYTLGDIDFANKLTRFDDKAITIILGNDIPKTDFIIGSAYPNPFNPSAIVPIELLREAVVDAKLYTLTGREVSTLANSVMNAGRHELRISSQDLTTGLYLVKVRVENVINVQKIAFVK